MTYRAVAGWGHLPEGWSFVEATSVPVDARDNVCVFNRGVKLIPPGESVLFRNSRGLNDVGASRGPHAVKRERGR